jgi:hypothetical protein
MSYRNKSCDAVQLAVGHSFNNKDLLLEALDTTGMRTAESNQRLALLGDALLKTILLDSWYAGGTAKGLPTTYHYLPNAVVHGEQVMAIIWSRQSVATPTWPSPPEMPALTSTSSSTLVISAGSLTKLLRPPSRPSWEPYTSTQLRTSKPSAV